MINLIPNKEKKEKVKDFYFRFTVVAFMVFGFSILVSCVAILPAYFFSLEERDLINDKLERQKNEPLPPLDSDVLVLAEDLNNKLNLIEKLQTNKYLVSRKIINEIIKEKMSDIKISSIRYQNDLAKGKTVSINGSAPSRERLLLFRKNLEDNVLFKKVDLPVSNFVKGSNIQFSINLIPV